MKVWHEETYFDGTLTIRIYQEWENAGMRWEYIIDPTAIGTRHCKRSGGCFYPDQPDEKLDGATWEDVAATALRAVKSLFPCFSEKA